MLDVGRWMLVHVPARLDSECRPAITRQQLPQVAFASGHVCAWPVLNRQKAVQRGGSCWVNPEGAWVRPGERSWGVQAAAGGGTGWGRVVEAASF